MNNKNQFLFIFITIILFWGTIGFSEGIPERVWGHQFGSPGKDVSKGIVVDKAGNIFIVGFTNGKVGDKSYGKQDVFVAKYNSNGKNLWIRQLGTNEKEDAVYITLKKGNLYICGDTGGKLGEKHLGKQDAFFSKLDTNGNLLWTKQFGTSAHDDAKRIKIDGSQNLYISGNTEGVIGAQHFGKSDFYIIKYNSDGDLVWKTQLGSEAEDQSFGMDVAKDGNIYITGRTNGRLGKTHHGNCDIFIAKLNPKGVVLWIKQYGTSVYDRGTGIVIDNKGDLFVSGGTMGNWAGKPKGNVDSIIFKCDSNGKIIWKKQFGTNLWDLPWEVSLCKDGSNDIIAGGCQHYKPCQSFLRRFDEKGNPGFVCEIIKEKKGYGVCSKYVAMDNSGNYYFTGGTKEDLFNTHKGEGDIFVVKYKTKASPSTTCKEKMKN